jgi:hypothetical protein
MASLATVKHLADRQIAPFGFQIKDESSGLRPLSRSPLFWVSTPRPSEVVKCAA